MKCHLSNLLQDNKGDPEFSRIAFVCTEINDSGSKFGNDIIDRIAEETNSVTL